MKIKDLCKIEGCVRHGAKVIVGDYEVSLQQVEQKLGTKSSMCRQTAEAEEECAQLGILRGGPPKQVTIKEACKVQEIDHAPSAKPPVLQKLDIPPHLHHMIKQT